MYTAFLILILLRPFISPEAFPAAGNIYLNLLLICLCVLLCRLLLNRTRNPGTWLTPLLPAAVFTITMLPPALSGNINAVNLFINQLAYFSAYLLASMTDRKRSLPMLEVIAAAGTGVAFLALYQYLYGFRHLSEYLAANGMNGGIARDYLESRRIFAPFVTANALAGFLAMAIPLRLIRRETALLPLLLITPVLLLTKSIGGITSLVCGAILFFSLSKHRFKKHGFAVFFILAALAAVVFIFRSAGNQSPLLSLQSRLLYWKETISIIKASLILGNGPGNCAGSVSSFAHNIFLQLWCELGIPGITAFLWFIIFTAHKACGYIRRTGDNLYLLIFCSWTVFLVHNLTDFTFFLPQVSFIWWLIGGILISAADRNTAGSDYRLKMNEKGFLFLQKLVGHKNKEQQCCAEENKPGCKASA